MDNVKVAQSPSKRFFIIWNKEKTIFITNNNSALIAIEETKRFVRQDDKLRIEDWELLTFSERIASFPQAIKDYFVKQIFANLKKSDLQFSLINFDCTNNTHSQILTDVIYCINENFGESKIEINENIDFNLSSIAIYELERTWKSEFTKNKTDKKKGKLIGSLNISLINSFISSSEKITAKLSNGKFFSIGYGNFEDEYEEILSSYSSK